MYTERKQKTLTNLNYIDIEIHREKDEGKWNQDMVTTLIGRNRKIFRNEN